MRQHAERTQTVDRTWLAVVVAIFGAIPGVLIAGLAVAIYASLVAPAVDGSWIPYLKEFTLRWGAELLRGGVTGAIAIGLARSCVSAADFRVARYATVAFWSAIALLLTVVQASMPGPSWDVSAIACFLLGLGAGLSADELISKG